MQTYGATSGFDLPSESLPMSPVSVTSTTTASAATSGVEVPETPCWSVQVLGPDPDSSALESAELFGEAAGWGVRATSCESAYVNTLPEDRFHMFTEQAHSILESSSYNCLDYIPNYDLEKYTQWQHTVSRMTAGQVLRALISVHNNNTENTFHSVANQKYTIPEKFDTPSQHADLLVKTESMTQESM